MMPHPQFREPRPPWKTATAVGCLVVVVGLLSMFLFVWFANGNYPSPRKQTLGNLKRVAICIALYADLYDNRLPLDTSSVGACADNLRKHGLTDVDMVSQNPGSPEFLGNGSLGQAVVTQVADPNSVILFFDSAPWPESKRRAVTFVDRSVRWITEAEFQKAVANNWRFVPTKP